MKRPVLTIQEDIAQIKAILAAQAEVLKEHVRRTEALEELVKPIQRRVYMLEGVFYFLGSLGVGSSLAYVIVRMMH